MKEKAEILGSLVGLGSGLVGWGGFLKEIVTLCDPTCTLALARTQVKLEFHVGPECGNIWKC